AGTKELAIIDELFATKVREGAGETAPAQGLFLDEVYYK
ncbi:tRNA pseudouridine(38-40) synthase TruA, partial [Enterococcus faecalis]|nr:tRNA pseudouridine(38-40) synthase TruA [Enterococcus faecalis]